MTVAGQTDDHLFDPLRAAYARANRRLPDFEILAGKDMPEPFRSLLVHRRDMTRTLEQFHGSDIHLRPLDARREADDYRRVVVLELDADGRAVEFGATRVHLDRIPAPWAAMILEARRPLGGVLNESGIPYLSRPSAFFRTAADAFIRDALRIGGDEPLYGRRNTLSDAAGLPLAEIIEILPSAP
jgi:chorismate-pyruvate lyase